MIVYVYCIYYMMIHTLGLDNLMISQNDDPRRKDHGIQSSEGLAQPRVLPQRGMRRGTASQDKNLQFKESKLL